MTAHGMCGRFEIFESASHFSDVNKDWTCKDKDQAHKDQDKDKDKDLTLVFKESLRISGVSRLAWLRSPALLVFCCISVVVLSYMSLFSVIMEYRTSGIT